MAFYIFSGNLYSYTTLNLLIFTRWWVKAEVFQLVKQGPVASLILRAKITSIKK